MFGKQNHSIVFVVVAVVLISSVFLAGCQKSSEKMIESATGGKAKVEGDKVTIETPGGTMQAGGAQEWPSKIPADVPKFTYGKIVSVVENNGPKGASFFVGIGEVTRADFEKYESALDAAGWKAVTSSKGEDGFFVSTKKGNSIVMASFSGGKGDKGFSGGITYTEGK